MINIYQMRVNASALYKRHIRIIPGVRSYVLATMFVFILGITVTVLSWYVDRQRTDTQKDQQISEQASSFERDIKSRLAIYEQMLRGASGLYKASDSVSKDEWQRFVREFDLQQNYPGVSSVGYVKYIQPNQIEAYLQFMRDQGYPDVKIMPEGARDAYAPLTYSEPQSEAGRKVVGYDVLTEESRAEAIKGARDSGQVSLSDKLTLLGDRGTNNQSSFAMYVATYRGTTSPATVDERRASLDGLVFAAFRADNFFEQAIDKSSFKAYQSVRVFDEEGATNDALLYQSADFNQIDQSQLSQVFTTKVFEHTWSFQFAGPINAGIQDAQRSNMILIGGATISFAMAGFLFLVMLTRARAIVYAKQNEAQQAKDDLLSLASHQLRTPATAVKQYLGMILEGYTGEIDKQQLPALQKAYASNERQLDTINQILYVAKADAGRLSINPRDFDVNQMVDDIILDLEDTLNENDQKVIFSHGRKKLIINADESSMRMVVENLISNAGKYSYSGAEIKVKTGVENKDIYISITDHGVGIDPDDFDKLFKKFSRIDNDLSLQVGGTGIGLYIDKVLVELHGGRIEVTSQPEKGSTFKIYLPNTDESNLTDGGDRDGPL